MNISNLKRASDSEVEKWLHENLNLTPYQKSKLRDDELIRRSPFKFYKYRESGSSNLLWRLSIVIFPLYILALYLIMPFIFLTSGKWGYSSQFVDKFFSPWANKIGF